MDKETKESIMDKPKFKAKIVALTEMRRQQLAAIAVGPVIPSEQIEILEDYLSISRKRRNSPLPLFKLQMNMLLDLTQVEKVLQSIKKTLRNVKKKFKRDWTTEFNLRRKLAYSK